MSETKPTAGALRAARTLLPLRAKPYDHFATETLWARIIDNETNLTEPPENGPYRLAIYNGKDELVTVITQVDNARPKVKELVEMLKTYLGNFSLSHNRKEVLAKVREVEAALGKAE